MYPHFTSLLNIKVYPLFLAVLTSLVLILKTWPTILEMKYNILSMCGMSCDLENMNIQKGCHRYIKDNKNEITDKIFSWRCPTCCEL